MKMKKIIVFLLCIFCLITFSSCSTDEDENELLSIELTKPEHITVEMGLIYQPKDIVVKAIYTNETRIVTSYAKFSHVDTNTLGTKTVEVTYKTKSATYELEVIKGVPAINYSLRIKEKPKKMIYYVDEQLDLEGIKIVMLKNDKEETEIDLDKFDMHLSLNGITKESLSEPGNYKLTFSIRHLEKLYSISLFIEVLFKEDNTPKDKLIVDQKQSKLEYWLNEVFDPTTMIVCITDEKEEQRVPILTSLCKFTVVYNNIVIEDQKFRETGAYIIQIEYGNFKCDVEVIVKYRLINKKLVLDLEKAKIKFTVGETFSSSGLGIYYYEDDVLKRIVSSMSCNFTLLLNGIEKPSLLLDEPGTYSVLVEFIDENVSEGYRIAVV